MVHPVNFTDLVLPYRLAPLAGGEADIEITVRVTRTSDELGHPFGRADHEVFAAHRALADDSLLGGLVHDLRPDLLLVCLE